MHILVKELVFYEPAFFVGQVTIELDPADRFSKWILCLAQR